MSLQIRPLEESDIPALLKIAKYTWGGYDYLPYVLNSWIIDSANNPFVMEFKQRVVACANIKIIENGRTGWLEGLRVLRWYRKRGYAWVMTQHLVNLATDMEIERLRFTTANDNRASQILARRIGMQEILRLNVFWKGNIGRLRWNYDIIPTDQCTTKEALALLRAVPDLIPRNIVVYNWYALDLSTAAIESIAEFAQFWRCGTNENTRAFSLGFLQTERDSKQWCTTIYALDKVSFRSMLSTQIQVAKAQNATGLMCVHPLDFKTATEIAGLKRGTEVIGLSLFEKRRPFIRKDIILS